MLRVLSRVVLIPTLSLVLLGGFAAVAGAQVTTASIAGIVNDAQGQAMPGVTVVAVHQPSGSTYTAVTRGDGRYTIPGMRVGGPYEVTASLAGFQTQVRGDVNLSLGVATDVDFVLGLAAVQETVTVSAVADPVFSSTRTGAATAVSRADIGSLPTISGRISDITRLTPQASGNSFGGQDNRLNNITIDGSFFNNAFGLGEGQPGGRTGVAPISLESLEQVQVNIAPYDVRQGSFVGAAINSVTRSGTNQFRGSVYHRMRNESFVGTEAAGAAVNPGTFTFRDTGFWVGGPVVRNRLFVFGNYENELSERPLNTLVANMGGEPIGGNITRVLASDLDGLSSFLSQRFGYETGGYQNIPNQTPAKRYLVRADYNVTNANKISFRYTQLDSSSDSAPSTSSSAGIGRTFGVNGGMFFERSKYSLLENIKSGIGEWTSVIGSTMSNSLIVGFTSNDESRGDIGPIFPYVDILKDGVSYA
ncbi:MAG: TonB-dependent receptor, partial [Acidobacteria bacterium]|nr:TonB-dependent receptor [Acidobacteriota bacterium]